MTVSKAATVYKVSKSTIYRWIKKGRLKAEKVGRSWRIKMTESKQQTEWPSDVHRQHAEADGLTANDFRRDQWPISNVRIVHPGYEMPREVSLLYQCDVPADMPEANKYDLVEPGTGELGKNKEYNKIPDPIGMTLSSIRFTLYEAGTQNKLDLAGSGHVDGFVQAFVPTQEDNVLWKRLTPGKTLQVMVVAIPVFYYLDESGSGRLDYAMTPDGYLRGESVSSGIFNLTLTTEGVLLLNGEERPKAPEFRDEESFAEYDRIVAEEKAEHERKERQLRERLAKEKAEREAQWAKEDAEREEARKKALAEAEAERKRNEQYVQRRAAQPPAVENKEILMAHYEAQFKGRTEHRGGKFVDVGEEKFREFCVNQAMGMGPDWKAAVKLIATDFGWAI